MCTHVLAHASPQKQKAQEIIKIQSISHCVECRLSWQSLVDTIAGKRDEGMRAKYKNRQSVVLLWLQMCAKGGELCKSCPYNPLYGQICRCSFPREWARNEELMFFLSLSLIKQPAHFLVWGKQFYYPQQWT